MALGSTQPLTEMSTRIISWDKGGRCVGLTTLPPSCADCLKIGSLKLLETSGPVKACNGVALSLYSWNYVLCLPNCCVGTPIQDSSYSQYTCYFNVLKKPDVEGQHDKSMTCAFHCLLQTFERDFVAALYACSEHIY
jgi:hypothetical protein